VESNSKIASLLSRAGAHNKKGGKHPRPLLDTPHSHITDMGMRHPIYQWEKEQNIPPIEKMRRS